MTDTERLAALIQELRELCQKMGLVYHVEIIGELESLSDEAAAADPAAEYARELAREITEQL
jgi:tagatose-1,6-bisphosphate aldolase